MNCPRCGAPSQVNDSRPTPDNFIKRRRSCTTGHRFVTYESTYAPSQARWARKNGTAAVAKWRENNPDKAAAIRLREKLKRTAVSESKLTGEPVEIILARLSA